MLIKMNIQMNDNVSWVISVIEFKMWNEWMKMGENGIMGFGSYPLEEILGEYNASYGLFKAH